MDLSKLPKLSETPKPPNNEPVEREAAPPPEPVGVGVEAWFSIGIGILLLLVYPRFLQWVSHRLFGTHFNPFIDQSSGAVVPYTQVPAFWSDLGPVLFGLVLIIDGLILAFVKRPVFVAIGLALIALATLYNFVYLVGSWGTYGIAPISFLAVLFGLYICLYNWKYLRLKRSGRAAPMT
jgi:hypothetical protein